MNIRISSPAAEGAFVEPINLSASDGLANQNEKSSRAKHDGKSGCLIDSSDSESQQSCGVDTAAVSRVVGLFFKSDRWRNAELAQRIVTADYSPHSVKFITGEESADGAVITSCPDWSEDCERMECLISIGGDGTFLRAANAIRELGIPLYGINTGRLGFLASGSPEDAVSDIRRILDGEYRILPRAPLRCVLTRDGDVVTSIYALNEITVTRGALACPIELCVLVNSEGLFKFLADGIIVSTPTGSTAYSLSAGGPVVHPDVNCLLIVPICPHSLHTRPVILSESETVTICPSSDNGEITISADGRLHFELRAGDRVDIALDLEKNIKVVKIDSKSYYDVLRSKLGWGRNSIDF